MHFTRKDILSVILFMLLTIIFVLSYRKQTEFISKRFKNYKKDNNGGDL